MSSVRSNGTDTNRRDIVARSFEYARRAIRLSRALTIKRDLPATIIVRQYLRSALSVGANVQEAQAAESRKDFVHKLAIARKEARECMYWLLLLDDDHLIGSERLSGLIEETRALVLILSKIIIVTRRNSNMNPDDVRPRSGDR